MTFVSVFSKATATRHITGYMHIQLLCDCYNGIPHTQLVKSSGKVVYRLEMKSQKSWPIGHLQTYISQKFVLIRYAFLVWYCTCIYVYIYLYICLYICIIYICTLPPGLVSQLVQSHDMLQWWTCYMANYTAVTIYIAEKELVVLLKPTCLTLSHTYVLCTYIHAFRPG